MNRTIIVFKLGAVCLVAAIGGCTWTQLQGDFAIPATKFQPPPLEKVPLGSSKEQVVEAIGEPDARIGMHRGEDGRVVETWEYWQYRPVDGPDEIIHKYVVVFIDNKVTRWESDVSRVNEVRVR